MVYVDVLPDVSQLIPTTACILIADPPTAKSYLDICDLCWYAGDSKPKQVKEVFGVIACQECYLNMKEINR